MIATGICETIIFFMRTLLLLVSILFLLFSSEYNAVTPETFGAIGNGLADDTDAIRKAFNSGRPISLNGTYSISKSIKIKSSIIGSGTILIANNDVSLICENDRITIKGISFDYQGHEGKLMRLINASNITISDCKFLNVGNLSTTQSEGMILIKEASNNIHIKNCVFCRCIASGKSSSAGIWIDFSSPEDRCHHIYVDHCYFDDFQPSVDADAIKVIGQNENVYLYVTNCEFHRCDKRAMKFQARECHSKNNVIYVTRPMYCAIDFQRGYGTSCKDCIILDYDGKSVINPNSGLLYRVLCIAQRDVTIKGLKVESISSISNTHQRAVGFQSFRDFDDGKISNIKIDRCNFDGQASLISIFDAVNSITKLSVRRTTFKSNVPAYEIILNSKKIYDSKISYTLKDCSTLGTMNKEDERNTENCIIKQERSVR